MTLVPRRFEVTQQDGKDRVVYNAPHHKTERRSFAPIKMVLPEGVLTDLLLVHITKGHNVMCACYGDQSKLFMTTTGMDFRSSKAAFSYWWGNALSGRWCPQLPAWSPRFKPSLGRTMYVEHVTSVTGNQPQLWDGPARCMGSSTKQWHQHYAPGFEARQMQDAANSNKRWRADREEAQATAATTTAPPAHATHASAAPPPPRIPPPPTTTITAPLPTSPPIQHHPTTSTPPRSSLPPPRRTPLPQPPPPLVPSLRHDTRQPQHHQQHPYINEAAGPSSARTTAWREGAATHNRMEGGSCHVDDEMVVDLTCDGSTTDADSDDAGDDCNHGKRGACVFDLAYDD